MTELTNSIISGLATGYFVNFSTYAVRRLFQKAIDLKPSLEAHLAHARTPRDFERVFEEAVGVIDAAAGDGVIDVDQSLLQALRGIRFDHQHGTVTITGSTLEAPILQTGGTGTGDTMIGGGTSMKSAATEIQVGQGASIRISGNAQIRQS